MDYIKVTLNISPKQPWTDIITQELADINFDSFMEEDNMLQAFVAEESFNENNLNAILDNYSSQEVEIKIHKEHIENQNWNAVWESDYAPVSVDQDLIIRAPFHEKEEQYKMSIEIQPQMSFGTGHHQTTYLLSKNLLDIDFQGKSVLDVGTGTGVLGILASLKGATRVFGTDIEEGAVENAIENCGRNDISNFEIIKGDIDCVPEEKFDILIANINKNVLKEHMPSYATLTKTDGIMFLSGFFETDVDELSAHAEKYNFKTEQVFTKETWAVIQLIKK